MQEDKLTTLSKVLQDRIEEILSDPEGKALTPEAAKSYAAVLKTLWEIERPESDIGREIIIKMEGGSDEWKH